VASPMLFLLTHTAGKSLAALSGPARLRRRGKASPKASSEAFVLCQLGPCRAVPHPSWRSWPQAHAGEAAGEGMGQLFKGVGGCGSPASPQSALGSVRLPLLSGSANVYFLFKKISTLSFTKDFKHFWGGSPSSFAPPFPNAFLGQTPVPAEVHGRFVPAFLGSRFAPRCAGLWMAKQRRSLSVPKSVEENPRQLTKGVDLCNRCWRGYWCNV